MVVLSLPPELLAHTVYCCEPNRFSGRPTMEPLLVKLNPAGRAGDTAVVAIRPPVSAVLMLMSSFLMSTTAPDANAITGSGSFTVKKTTEVLDPTMFSALTVNWVDVMLVVGVPQKSPVDASKVMPVGNVLSMVQVRLSAPAASSARQQPPLTPRVSTLEVGL